MPQFGPLVLFFIKKKKNYFPLEILGGCGVGQQVY